MNDLSSDIYVYKMTADCGGAPCVVGGILSLAICKPRIRKGAREGTLIFGFGAKHYQERLIYIACVTHTLEGQDYYRLREYARRPDCIYRVDGGRAVRKSSARYHNVSDERKKDVGPFFENAFVLLSEDFRYWPAPGSEDTELGVFMGSEVRHGEAEVHTRVQA